METPQPVEPAGPESIARRIAKGVIDSIKAVVDQLRVADLNPHEGKLRGSTMPEKYMNIPDHPPINDDNN